MTGRGAAAGVAAALSVVLLGCGTSGGGAAQPTALPTTTTTPPPSTGPTTAPPTSAPPSAPPTALVGHVVDRIPTTSRVVALTFDAGANADGVPAILAALRAAHVPATFFLTGTFVRMFPAQSRQLAAAGRVGDHTVTHPHLPTLSDSHVRTEVLDTAAMIRATTGAQARPLFRFPFGDSNARTVALVNGLGFVAVGWTVDTLGWEGRAGHISPDVVLQRVLSAAQPGEIVLMHVGSNPDDHTTFDADALPRVISALRAKGYGFVTLDELFR